MSNNLTRRSITSVFWTSGTGIFRIVILFAQSILLARLLDLETFGTFGYANTLVVLTGTFTNLGLDGAFLNRSAETEDEDRAAAIHFTLRNAASVLWLIVMVALILFWAEDVYRLALIVITLTGFVTRLTSTAKVLLVRRVVHRRLSLFDSAQTMLSSAVALLLAWLGYELWALLSINILNMFLSLFFFVFWRPVWRPRLTWDREGMRYFIHFGQRTFAAKLLATAVNRIDDLWAGYFLGSAPLAIYQKAYTFANYPRRVIADPISAVSGGTFAELKNDRERLSKAFFRTNALLVRSGFLFGGALVLIAPEFIHLLLTDKWMPMLDIFRLMLLYTLFEPLDQTLSSMFVAVGRPEQLVRIKLVQFAVLVVGLLTLGRFYELIGVAITIDLMLLVGIGFYMWQALEHIDFSITSLLAIPLLAITVAMPVTLFVEQALLLTDWFNLILKSVVFGTVYCLILLLFERDQVLRIVQQIASRLGRRT